MCIYTLTGAWQTNAYCGIKEGEQAAAPVHTQCCDHAFFPEYVFMQRHQTQIETQQGPKLSFTVRK